MPPLNVKLISSIEELREKTAHWDDLWARSSVATPLARAELIAQFIEQFSPKAKFFALIVESQERFLAALPLVETKIMKFVSAGMNPSNAWSLCGHLLVDFDEDAESIIDVLISGLQMLPFSILWLDYIRFNDPEWSIFKKGIDMAQIPSQWQPRYYTAVARISNDYEKMISNWNKKGIADIHRRIRKYYSHSNYRLLKIKSHDDLSNYLRSCFELENKGWKGEFKGSILSKKMDFYFEKLALNLTKNGNFCLYILIYEGKIIAFNYCLVAKNTIFLLKTSYDPAYREYAPGQVMTFLIFESLSRKEKINNFDFMGVFMPYQKVWNPNQCLTGQVVIPLKGLLGRSFFFTYDTIMPKIRKLKYKCRTE